MLLTKNRFIYRHKPTGKWVYLETYGNSPDVTMHLLEDFPTEGIYHAKNIIEEDLLRSRYKGEIYAANNFLEFELVELEVIFKEKAVNDNSSKDKS
jgi:hypothetical protein